MSALPPKADIAEHDGDVRFVPKADILRCGKVAPYSITSSASASNQSGNYYCDRSLSSMPRTWPNSGWFTETVGAVFAERDCDVR